MAWLTHEQLENALAWMHNQHCGFWCPGAKIPGHQYPQCWVSSYYTGPDSYKHVNFTVYYNDVIMSTMASQITSLTIVYSRRRIKENIKIPRHWPLLGKFPGDRWIHRTRASNAENASIWWRHHGTAPETKIPFKRYPSCVQVKVWNKLPLSEWQKCTCCTIHARSWCDTQVSKPCMSCLEQENSKRNFESLTSDFRASN